MWRYIHRVAGGVGGDAHGLHAGGLRQQGDRRPQGDMTIRDVKGQNAARVQMFSIDGQRLGGEEVDRNGVARECVDNEDVEVLRGFASKGRARIPFHDLHLGGRIADVGEGVLRDGDYRRIDVVEADVVAGTPVSGDGSGAKADDADVARANA